MTKRPVITKTVLAKHLRQKYPKAIPSVVTAQILVDALLCALREELLSGNVVALDGIGSFKLLPAKKMRKVTPQKEEWLGEAAPRMSVSLYTEFSRDARERIQASYEDDVAEVEASAPKRKRTRKS